MCRHLPTHSTKPTTQVPHSMIARAPPCARKQMSWMASSLMGWQAAKSLVRFQEFAAASFQGSLAVAEPAVRVVRRRELLADGQEQGVYFRRPILRPFLLEVSNRRARRGGWRPVSIGSEPRRLSQAIGQQEAAPGQHDGARQFHRILRWRKNLVQSYRRTHHTPRDATFRSRRHAFCDAIRLNQTPGVRGIRLSGNSAMSGRIVCFVTIP